MKGRNLFKCYHLLEVLIISDTAADGAISRLSQVVYGLVGVLAGLLQAALEVLQESDTKK